MTAFLPAALRRMLALGFVVALFTAFVACNEDSGGPEEGTTVRDVEEADGPFMEGLLGTTVTVSGDVSAVYDDRVFEIAGDDIGGEGLVVVVPTADILDPGGIEEGDLFRVTGEVQRLVVVDIERDYDLDLDVEIEAEFEDGGPMIVAETIEPALAEGVADDDGETSPSPTGTTSPTPSVSPGGN